MLHCPSQDQQCAALCCSTKFLLVNNFKKYTLVIFKFCWFCMFSTCGSGVSLSDHHNTVVSTLDGFVINQSLQRQQLYKWHTGLKQPGVWPPPSPPILPQEAAFPLPVACLFRWKCMVLVCIYAFVVENLCHMSALHVSNIFFFFYGETEKYKMAFLIHFTDLFIS